MLAPWYIENLLLLENWSVKVPGESGLAIQVPFDSSTCSLWSVQLLAVSNWVVELEFVVEESLFEQELNIMTQVARSIIAARNNAVGVAVYFIWLNIGDKLTR